MIRTLIVDDEPLARKSIRLLLEDDPGIEVVGEARDGPEAVALVRRSKPELMFLDVRMPGMDGFDVLAELAGEVLPLVVFVTAFDEYAIRAFEVHALDYVMKPFDDDRFAAAVGRVKERLRGRDLEDLGRRMMALLEETARPEPGPGSQPGPARRLAVKSSGKVLFLRVDEIDWIEAADYYVRIHVGSRSYLHRESMQRLEQTLDPRRFVRIHRSAIINLARVRTFESCFKGDSAVVLEDGTRLRMSRGRREQAEQALRSLT